MTRLIERISLGRAFGVDRLRADSTDRPRRGGAGIGGGYPAYFAFCAKGRGRFPIRTGKGASGKDFFAAMPLCSNEIPRKCGESFACGIVGARGKTECFFIRVPRAVVFRNAEIGEPFPLSGFLRRKARVRSGAFYVFANLFFLSPSI